MQKNLSVNDIYGKFDLPRNDERRIVLLEQMKALKSSGVNCFSCTGLCCTSISNSMQTDAIQTLELYEFLKEEGRIDEALVERLKENIQSYRLDYELSTGGRTSFRRTYTCPFYNEGPKGCSISPESKPYGCLGFNALKEDVKKGEDCTSDLETLQKREDLFEALENKANEFIKSELNLYWDKKPMPVALLEYIEKLEK